MDGLWMNGVLAQAEIKAAEAAGATSDWKVFLIAVTVILVVFILPFVAGQLIAQWLRLKDLATPMGVVLFAIALALAPFGYQIMQGRPWYTRLHLGIDLAGGTNLIYAVDREKAKADGKTIDKATMDKLVGAVTRRVNPAGVEEMTIRRVGDDRLEVIVPGADREAVDRMKRSIINLGSLEFAILANEKDHRREIESARQLPPNEDNLRQGGRVAASWRHVAAGQDASKVGGDRTADREVDREVEGKMVKVKQFLVVHDPPDRQVTGKYLTRAQPSMDDRGQLAVAFSFNFQGGQLFSALTGRYLPDSTDGFHRNLAILLNGEIHSAPRLITRISNNGQIVGHFTREEIDELVNVLNAGALEVPLIETPVSEFTVSPLLGVDVQTKGVTAIIVSALAVFVFMLVYYHIAGITANLCLVLNLLLVVGSMAFIEATFTLPGLAGLVLTIGMAVDSNVLIYERIREELARGASLRVAIENGFDKALSAIVDGNVTTLITAAILYMIGSDQIRGFAVSLFIGLTMSLFSTLYFTHLCFKVMERKRWIKSLKMMRMIGHTNVDFLKSRGWAFAISGVLIGAGFLCLYLRGGQNMDIDFTGGTMVTFEFTQPQETDTVRAKLNEQFAPMPVSLERLVKQGEGATASAGQRFRIRVTEPKQDLVAKKLSDGFTAANMPLVKVTMDVGEVSAIPAGEKSTDAADPDRFAGGHKAPLTFKDAKGEPAPLGAATATTYLADQLRKTKGVDGKSKYDSAETLVNVVGTTAATPDPTATTSTEKFLAAEARATSDVAPDDFTAALAMMQTFMAENPVFEEINAFDTSVSNEMKRDAILAILASFVVIVIYLWFRFEYVYFGIAAIAAVFHDVLVTLGATAVAAYFSGTPIGAILMFDDFKINLALVASLLTIVGYSLNDTIVIYDRLREIRGKNPHISYSMINLSVNETLSRTILTAVTVFMVVLILYIFGGEGIHGFAFAMLIGTITGCYSTIYIANPVLLWLVTREHRTATGSAMAPAAS
jgi:SecD/SecF fusion protein